MKNKLLFIVTFISMVSTANAGTLKQRLHCEIDQEMMSGDITMTLYTDGVSQALMNVSILQGGELSIEGKTKENDHTLTLKYEGVTSEFSTQQEDPKKQSLNLKLSDSLFEFLKVTYTDDKLYDILDSGLYFVCSE
jgi:hypothetical protein